MEFDCGQHGTLTVEEYTKCNKDVFIRPKEDDDDNKNEESKKEQQAIEQKTFISGEIKFTFNNKTHHISYEQELEEENDFISFRQASKTFESGLLKKIVAEIFPDIEDRAKIYTANGDIELNVDNNPYRSPNNTNWKGRDTKVIQDYLGALSSYARGEIFKKSPSW